jgi:hypothetical protein
MPTAANYGVRRIAIVLGFLPKFGAPVLTIPGPLIGGCCTPEQPDNSRRFIIRSPRWRAAESMAVRQDQALGGLQVQGHLKFCRKLHREIARLLAAQNAIHISGGATRDVYRVDSVGEQAAVSGKDNIPPMESTG